MHDKRTKKNKIIKNLKTYAYTIEIKIYGIKKKKKEILLIRTLA